ncbi:hypothetical protein BASA81_001446 [Batrachochytrium salamandrivorans]|nr:hypothetical protein BASA81_001446 [Batrachochytrium salamandrivorans]
MSVPSFTPGNFTLHAIAPRQSTGGQVLHQTSPTLYEYDNAVPPVLTAVQNATYEQRDEIVYEQIKQTHELSSRVPQQVMHLTAINLSLDNDVVTNKRGLDVPIYMNKALEDDVLIEVLEDPPVPTDDSKSDLTPVPSKRVSKLTLYFKFDFSSYWSRDDTRSYLKCASREIWRQSDQSASSRTQISNVETAAAIYKNSKFLSTAVGTYGQPVSGAAAIATGIDFLTYVPVFVPFFEVINNYLSLYNTEPLVLEVHFNTNERMGLPDTQALRASTSAVGSDGYIAKLYMENVVFNRKTESELTALETGTTFERPRFSYTYTTQIVPVVAAQVLVKDGFYAYKCNINTDVSASDTFISIRKVGGLVTTGADIGNFTPIAKHSLRFNNRAFHENLPATVTSYLSDIKSRGGLALSRTNVLGTSLSTSATDKKHLHLPWCDEPWERTRNSGTLAFKALGGPELTLFTGTNIGDAAYTYEIVIVHQAQTMLTQLGKNGVVEQGISR